MVGKNKSFFLGAENVQLVCSLAIRLTMNDKNKKSNHPKTRNQQVIF